MLEIAGSINSRGGVLFGQTTSIGRTSAVCFEHNGGMEEQSNRVYKERHLDNVWTTAMSHRPVGRVVLSDEIVPLRQLRRTSFFDEVLQPQNVAHNAMIALATQADFRVAFNICRSARKGPFEEDDRRFLAGLIPHLNRSLLLGMRLEGYHALRRADHRVLDRLCSGVILLDRRQKVIYVNQTARSLAVRGEALRIANGAVSTHSSQHTRLLEGLLRKALQGAPTCAMSLPSVDDGGLLTVLVTSVRSADVACYSEAGMRDAAVLIFVVDPAIRVEVPASWLVQAYGLTAAEARVALAVASGLTTPEAAAKLGLTTNTIKTHLHKVFAKTGVSRQTELARCIAALGSIVP
ncbi:MAG: helix-turn-helix transcriptional regulator [Hyphomicrobiales bacterium]|nr:helix-turn-helix transcriptional regulator [Hyphomicrobiales bacterium]